MFNINLNIKCILVYNLKNKNYRGIYSRILRLLIVKKIGILYKKMLNSYIIYTMSDCMTNILMRIHWKMYQQDRLKNTYNCIKRHHNMINIVYYFNINNMEVDNVSILYSRLKYYSMHSMYYLW
jgi:hypothetical protein